MKRLVYWLAAKYLTTPAMRARVARRLYDPDNPYPSMAEVEEVMRNMSPLEEAMLDRWERENPPPVLGRDWNRHPEDRYE